VVAQVPEAQREEWKRRAATYAATLVEDGMKVGLGSGSTSRLFLQALADRVRAGLRCVGVPTSEATARIAESLGMAITTLEEEPDLDLAIDGADEVDPALNLIKGGGGALLREKIVASAARRFVVIVDHSKLVPSLGTNWAVPVEVVPFGWTRTSAALIALGAQTTRRERDGTAYLTDGGHCILDCRFGAIAEPAMLAVKIKALTGVVDHGLFVHLASMVVVGTESAVEILRR
jgi:ribose 5-phosphate isomerase A